MKENKKDNSKNNTHEIKHSKKFIIILSAVVLIAVLIGSGIALALSSFSGDGATILNNNEKVKITKSITSTIEYETYDNSLVSLKIPKGWKVEVAPFDYIHYSFKAYNPDNPNYRFIFMMKLEGFNKSSTAKSWQQTYYPNNIFAQLPVIDPQTTESFYKVWNETATYVNKNDAKYEYLPIFDEFTVIENIATNEIGGDVLRATYKDSDGKLVQGLFTAAVKSAGTYYVNSNVFDLTSSKIDVWPLMVYNTILMTAPNEEFNNWQSI